MSATYQAVQWNRNKKIYDLILLGSLLSFIILDILGMQLSQPVGRAIGGAEALIRAAGDASFLLLTLILCLGPLARLNTVFLPLLYNRRHMGVVLFLTALLHGGLALVWYHGFAVVDPFTSVFSGPGRYIGGTNTAFQPLGVFALLILFLLASTSHDYWNTVLGPSVWKTLHMGVYGAYGLVVSHVVFGPLQDPVAAGMPAWAVWASLLLVGGLHSVAAFKPSSLARSQKAGADWVKLFGWQDIQAGEAMIVGLDGDRRVAVFRTEAGEFGAISNACKHQNGPLGEGCIKDGLVTCPWHGFQYRLADGCSPPPYREKIPTYELAFKEGELYLNSHALPEGTARPLVRCEAGEVPSSGTESAPQRAPQNYSQGRQKKGEAP